MCKHAKSHKSVNVAKKIPVCKENHKYCVKVNFVAIGEDLTYEMSNATCEKRHKQVYR